MRIPLAIFFAALAVVACGRQTAASSPAPQASPAAAAAVPPADAGRVTGTVAETMDSGGYTYVRLSTPGGDVWAAVTQAKVEKGATLTISGSAWMENFESKTLNRKFDRILFGALEGAGVPVGAAAGDAAQLPPGHPAMGGGLPAGHPVPSKDADAGAPVKVEKAAGGLTVAEVHAQRASLKGKPVVVRAKVVKFLAGIMDRNWLHLRDGSGSADKGDNDLTVTTKQTVAVGDVVTVKAAVGVDRDFGAGYVYGVILEDAQIEK